MSANRLPVKGHQDLPVVAGQLVVLPRVGFLAAVCTAGRNCDVATISCTAWLASAGTAYRFS